MLTSADFELITAAVDGELPPDREFALHSLLARDPAAAALFTHLRHDSRRIRGLPRQPAPSDLAGIVRARVVDLPRPTAAIANVPARTASARVGWLPYIVAASLLLAVTSASFWVSLREESDDGHRRMVQRERLPRLRSPVDRQTLPSESMADRGPELSPYPRLSLPGISGAGEPQFAVFPPPSGAVPETAPSPRQSGGGNVVGSPPLGTPIPFESIEARLPLLTTIPELDREDVRNRIAAELSRDPAFRLDLFVKDVPRSATLFQAVARASGVVITVDPTTQDRLRRKLPTALAVYTDALTPEEIAKLLVALARRDQSEKGGPVFATLHLVPAQATEHRDIRDLFGVDLGLGKRKASGPKSVTSGHAAPSDKAIRSAIMLTYLPTAVRASPFASKEIKAFLDHRVDRRTNAVPLLVVIRPVL